MIILVLKKFFAQFPADKTRCVMESSSVWYGVYMFMTEKLGFGVVSNPYYTKAIVASKKKTDKVDAMTLADLHRGNLCLVQKTMRNLIKDLYHLQI